MINSAFRPLARQVLAQPQSIKQKSFQLLATTSTSPINNTLNNRSFHTSRQSNLDLFSFFRSRKEKEQALSQTQPAVKTESTKNVIKNIEAREAANEVSKTLKPVELDVIGQPPAKDAEWEDVKNGFSVENAFPINTVSPDVDLELVKSTIFRLSRPTKADAAAENAAAPEGEEWMKKIDLFDFHTRFLFVKSVSKALNIAVPDNQLGTLVDAHALYKYFSTKVAGHKYDPKRPDAIYLDPKEFEGTNITIVKKELSKGQEEKKWKQLVEKAKQAEEEALKKSLEL